MALELLTVPSNDMTPAQAREVIDLCSSVFHIDYGSLMDLCPERVHVLGYLGGRLVAHALWLPRRLRAGEGPWLNAAYVEGVAVCPDQRGRGYGSAVMRQLQEAIAGYDLGALSPAVPEWYERLGWVRWQGPLRIVKAEEVLVTPGECVMVYATPRTGELDLGAALTGEWRPFELW